jgi:hypothetical protein
VKICNRILLVLWLLWLTGCSAMESKPVADQGATGELPTAEGWWYARFRIASEKDNPPLWHIDTLIAGEIIAPVFERNFKDIYIWRVHRRAAADDYGHVFSFIFYSTPQGAQRIYADISANAVLTDLQANGLVTGIDFDNLAGNTRPDIEDTSDANWPVSIQQTWPALIMGASRMWLDLVGQLSATHAGEENLIHRYELVEQDITRLWAQQGQHAVLHHLSALFAYQPLLIRY